MKKMKVFKAILSVAIMAAMIISLCGCDSDETSSRRKRSIYGDDYPTYDEPQGKMYNKVALTDTQAGIVAFEGLIAEGWTASIQSDWNVVSYMCPGMESVTLTSPDEDAVIYIDSQQIYMDDSKYAEGINYDYYTTYYHYMDADTYIQEYMDNACDGSAILIKDFEDDTDILSNADAYINAEVSNAMQVNSWINSGNYGVSYSLTAIPSTMSKRQYQYKDEYIECSCIITGADSVLTSNIVGAETSRIWMVPYSIVYEAENEEVFNKYYDDYNFMVANSYFTTDYYAIIEYVSGKISNAYSSYYAAKSQAGLDAMNEYIDSNYSSTSSQSTHEKVMEMWDDYIKDVDCYKAEDGTKIKTSIYNDVVAQNGDSYYVGTKAGIPLGYSELAKSY